MDHVDLLVVAALPEEFDAIRSVASAPSRSNPGVDHWLPVDQETATAHIRGDFITAGGSPISIAVAQPPRMGGRVTAPVATALVDRLAPTCVAMSGVCAGNPARVALGDVVVADVTYAYDEGRQTLQGFEGDHRQMSLDSRWRRAARNLSADSFSCFGAASVTEAELWFLERLLANQEPRSHPARGRYFPPGTWTQRIEKIRSKGLIERKGPSWRLTRTGRTFIERHLYDDVDGPERLPFAVEVGPLASGTAVVKDGKTWDRLVAMGVRTILGLDMEAATIATVAQELQVPYWLVVKGVVDYADPAKEDRYRRFAAHAAAEVLLELSIRMLANADTGGDMPTGQNEAETPATPRQLPPDLPDFVGRERQLSELDRILDDRVQKGSARVAAISGPPGIGKTALALRWAHQVRERFPDGDLYIDLRGYSPSDPVTHGDALRTVLTRLGVAELSIPEDIDDRAAMYRSLIRGRRILVVLDNAYDSEQVRLLMPGDDTPSAVVTSRDDLHGLIVEYGARPVTVDVLGDEHSAELLRSVIGQERCLGRDEEIDRLTEYCGRLPLALRIAGAIVALRPQIDLAMMVAELADEQRRLQRMSPVRDQRTAVRTVFSWSYRHLSDAAALLFRRFGLHPGATLGVHAMSALADARLSDVRDAVDLLVGASLVEQTKIDQLRMHDLLKLYAAERAAADDNESSRVAAVERLLDYYLATTIAAAKVLYPERPEPKYVPESTFVPALASAAEARAWLSDELDNLMAASTFATTHGHHAFSPALAMALRRYLDMTGRFGLARAIEQNAEESGRASGDDFAAAGALAALGVTYMRLGLITEALKVQGKALIIFRELGDRRHVATVLNNMALSHQAQGRDLIAIEHLEEVLDICEELGDPLRVAQALGNLANSYGGLGRYQLAIDLSERAIAIQETAGIADSEAITRNDVTTVYLILARYEDAQNSLDRALALSRESGARAVEAQVLGNLARVSHHRGMNGSALEYAEAGLEIFREIGHRQGQAELLGVRGLMKAYNDDRNGAVEDLGEAVSIAKDLGSRRLEVELRNLLGEAYWLSGDGPPARLEYEIASALAEQIGDRLGRAIALSGLAKSLAVESPERSQELLRHASSIYDELGIPSAGRK